MILKEKGEGMGWVENKQPRGSDVSLSNASLFPFYLVYLYGSYTCLGKSSLDLTSTSVRDTKKELQKERKKEKCKRKSFLLPPLTNTFPSPSPTLNTSTFSSLPLPLPLHCITDAFRSQSMLHQPPPTPTLFHTHQRNLK